MTRGTGLTIGGTPAQGRWLARLGWLLGAPVGALLLFSAGMKLGRRAEVLPAFVGHLGYPEGALLGIALAEVASAVLYLVPRTAVLGAVLLTGYMGGAMATHVRVGEPFAVQLAVGVAAWAGLWLRDPRLRALLPLRSKG